MQHLKVVWNRTARLTPLAFPLMVERMSARMTNENLKQRIERMKRQRKKVLEANVMKIRIGYHPSGVLLLSEWDAMLVADLHLGKGEFM